MIWRRLLLLMLVAPSSWAANRYWCGPATSLCSSANWNCNDAGPITNWTTASNCVGANAAVPTSVDDVFFDGVGGGAANSTMSATITVNSLDMTGYANTLTHNSPALLIAGNGVVFKLAGTYTPVSVSSIQFTGTSGNTLITTGGKLLADTKFNGAGGTWTLQDAIAAFSATASDVTLTSGTLDTNGKAVSAATFVGTGAAARTLTMGASTFTLTNTLLSPWAVTSSMVLTANTGTIKFTGGGASTKTFDGGGLTTYNNVYFSGSGTGAFIVTGSNTFADIKMDTPPHTLNFTAGTTNTVTTFTVAGAAANLMTIGSVTAASHTLTKAGGGTITCNYCSISYSTATPAATWYATNSTNGGNNSGWVFCLAGETPPNCGGAKDNGGDWLGGDPTQLERPE